MKQTRYQLVNRLLNQYGMKKSRKELQNPTTKTIRDWIKEIKERHVKA